MIRIGICDDELEARQALRSAIERILDRRAVKCEIYDFSSGEGLLNWLQKHTGELDLLFLDIEMRGINGMEAAKEIRQKNSELFLAFVTAYDKYVFDGYSVDALGYVIKPFRSEQLEDILYRTTCKMFSKAKDVFVCRNAEGVYRIPKSSILYFYSDKRKVTCVTENRRYTFYSRLDDISTEAGPGFVRIHQRYLVRAEAVDRIEGHTAIVKGNELPVSRSYHTSALAAITRAVFKEDQ